MSATQQPGIADSPWRSLVDGERLKHHDVVALLRRLAEDAVKHLFPSNPKSPDPPPKLSPRDIRLLRPLLGGTMWSLGHRRRVLRGLLDAMQLSDPDSSLETNELAMFVAVSTRRTGLFGRLRARWAARGSPLLGAGALLSVFEEVAWSDPRLTLRLVGHIRKAWRAFTAFHPDEPEWPSQFSPALLRLVIAAAIERPAVGFFSSSLVRRRCAIAVALEASLLDVGPTLEQRSAIEQLIAVESLRHASKEVQSRIWMHLQLLPIATLDVYKELLGADIPHKQEKAAAGAGTPQITPVVDRVSRRVL